MDERKLKRFGSPKFEVVLSKSEQAELRSRGRIKKPSRTFWNWCYYR